MTMDDKKFEFWRGRTEATLESITIQIERLPDVIEASVARGIRTCPSGLDRETRMRVLEHQIEGHLAVNGHSQQSKVAFWMPLVYSILAGLIVGFIVIWAGKP